MAKKIAINGFGRIGRLVFRQLIADEATFEVVAINDLTDTKTLAHLLKYDTAHGPFQGEVDYKENSLIVNGKEIRITKEKDPKNLPWKELKVDLVVESTGFFVSREAAQAHIDAGAKKVAISAPAKGDLKTIVYSVNEDKLEKGDQVISVASCTTNALAPIAKILDESFKIKWGFMTTIHAYTADQPLQDRPHSDLRRARAGAQNFTPTTTGAAVAVGLVLPQLKGKFDGIAVRGPIITGSLVDLVVEFEKKGVTAKDVNNAVKVASKKAGIKEAVRYTEDPLVSSDIIGETHGTIFDADFTKELVVDGKTYFKILTWYDNENSYVSQYVRTIKVFLKK